MKQSEEDFVNDGLTGEELEAISAASAEPVAEDDPPTDGGQPPQPDKQPENNGPEKVDIRALQEARASERQLRAELAKQGEERARLDERVKMLAAAMQAQTTAEPKTPTMEEDPFGNIDHRFQGTTKELEALRAEIKAFKDAENQRAQQAQLQHERQQIMNRAQMISNEAAKKHPDVNDAVQHVVNSSVAELQRRVQVGMLPPEQYEEALQNHFTALCAQAPEDPDQFAEYIRSHARYWNWQGAKTQAQPSVQDLAARQERHQSLSGTSGGEAPQALDAKALATMSDKEFKALMSSVQGRKQVDQIMGG